MKISRITSAVCACALLFIAASTNAALLTMRFEGPLTYVHPELDGAFSIGDVYTALVTYESSTPDSNTAPDTGSYGYAITSIDVQVGSYVATSNGGNITVYNNADPDSMRDAIFFSSSIGFGLTGAPVGNLTPIGFLVQLDERSGTALSNTDIPTSSINTSAFNLGNNQLSLNFATTNPTGPGRQIAAENFTATLVAGTPEEQIIELINMVISMNIQKGISNALDHKLDNALNALEDANTNNDTAAINLMYAFIYSVEAQRGKEITDTEADTLIVKAQGIIDALNE